MGMIGWTAAPANHAAGGDWIGLPWIAFDNIVATAAIANATASALAMSSSPISLRFQCSSASALAAATSKSTECGCGYHRRSNLLPAITKMTAKAPAITKLSATISAPGTFGATVFMSNSAESATKLTPPPM
jgi:hypothetical protein